jgi:DNA-binding NarL/FixJ family response regulator
VAARLLHEFGRVWQPPPAGARLLDERETAILRHIGHGASNREIGVALNLAEKTIKKTLTRIFTKLEITDRTQAAVYAAQHGLLDETTQ